MSLTASQASLALCTDPRCTARWTGPFAGAEAVQLCERCRESEPGIAAAMGNTRGELPSLRGGHCRHLCPPGKREATGGQSWNLGRVTLATFALLGTLFLLGWWWVEADRDRIRTCLQWEQEACSRMDMVTQHRPESCQDFNDRPMCGYARRGHRVN